MKDLIGNYGSNEHTYCKASGKICLTKREAGEQLGSMKHHLTTSHAGKSSNKPKRAYYCKDCGSYHVTHLAQRTKAKKPLKVICKDYGDEDYNW